MILMEDDKMIDKCRLIDGVTWINNDPGYAASYTYDILSPELVITGNEMTISRNCDDI